LLKNSMSSYFLLIGRVAVLTENTLNQNSELGVHGFMDGPIDSDVIAYHVDQLTGNGFELM
jgi:hypothetical protein